MCIRDSAIFSLILEKPSVDEILSCSTEILYASVLGSGICYMFQVIAQKYTDPTVAALLMSLESVFGAIAGVIILGESFTMKEILGSACVFASVTVSYTHLDVYKRQVETPIGNG